MTRVISWRSRVWSAAKTTLITPPRGSLRWGIVVGPGTFSSLENLGYLRWGSPLQQSFGRGGHPFWLKGDETMQAEIVLAFIVLGIVGAWALVVGAIAYKVGISNDNN